MQPTLRQVPPSVGRFSTTATFMPSCAALMAATYPPGPPPMTMRLYIPGFTVFARGGPLRMTWKVPGIVWRCQFWKTEGVLVIGRKAKHRLRMDRLRNGSRIRKPSNSEDSVEFHNCNCIRFVTSAKKLLVTPLSISTDINPPPLPPEFSNPPSLTDSTAGGSDLRALSLRSPETSPLRIRQ